MNLEIRRFWFLANQIERLRAELDLERLQILASVGSAEAYKKATEHLKKTIGQIIVFEPTGYEAVRKVETGLDPEFDREGLRALKARIAAGI